MWSVCVVLDNPLKTASVSVAIRVLDVNDNPPSITHYYEAFLCDRARAGQVWTFLHVNTHTHTSALNFCNRGVCVSQLVQSIRAVDVDEPIGGQRFRYTLTPEAQNNPNFTLTDNHGNCLTLCQPHHLPHSLPACLLTCLFACLFHSVR